MVLTVFFDCTSWNASTKLDIVDIVSRNQSRRSPVAALPLFWELDPHSPPEKLRDFVAVRDAPQNVKEMSFDL